MKFKKNLSMKERINAVMEKYPCFTRVVAYAEATNKEKQEKIQ